MTTPAPARPTPARAAGFIRRVAVVTGTRAEYGVLRSTIRAIADHPRLHLQLVVTGMHLLRRFGTTVRCIERDGWTIDARVPMQRGDDHPLDQARGLGRGVSGLTKFFDGADTDIVLVLGDRIEAMAAALAATTTGRFIAHVHGGDVAPGDVDDALRHSLTKLAHVHLAATKQAARRIIRLGERPDFVHVVGAPGLDDLYAIAHDTSAAPRPRRDALVIQHAYGRPPAAEQRVMTSILRAVRHCGLSAVAVYPNSDRGHTGIVQALRARACHPNGRPTLRVVKSLDRDRFLRMLINARVLIGNSSSGIIEAPAVGTPVVNVGPRQAGRLRARAAVLDARETFADIRQNLQNALQQRPKNMPSTPYGDGSAGRRIARIIASTPLTSVLRRKANTF